jgi:hypothetical protein
MEYDRLIDLGVLDADERIEPVPSFAAHVIEVHRDPLRARRRSRLGRAAIARPGGTITPPPVPGRSRRVSDLRPPPPAASPREGPA